MVKEINSKKEFDEAITLKGLVVVDFFATWCGPCKMIAPMLDKFAAEYDSVSFIKVDVEKVAEAAQQYSITSMPTILFFKDGKEIHKIIGVNPSGLKQALSTHA